MTLRPVALPLTLSLMPTFQCTAACSQCGTLSSPHVKTALGRRAISAAIQEAAISGFGLVVFTGGEATLAGADLLSEIAEVRDCGLLSRLVTNCHWATDQATSDHYIGQLASHGLNEINFSTGDQHARFVPIERVLMAVRSSLASNFSPAVMIEVQRERGITKELLESHPHYQKTKTLFPRSYVRLSESPWMPLSPRRIARYPDGVAIDKTNLSACTGCDSILSTLTVGADGALGACCGLGMRLIPELRVGTLGETSLSEAVQNGEEDLLKRWIRAEGPERILAWAAEKDPSIEWEGMYAHRCQACIRLYKDPKVRSLILNHHMEKIPDVLFSEWLLHAYEPDQAPEPTRGGAT